MTTTIHCKLVGQKFGIYTVFVFQDDNGNYHMCTKLPNWGSYSININDTGFLTYETAIAGDKYFDRQTGTYKVYQYTNNYFQDFILDFKNDVKIIL